jgi:hypothetical protein
MPIWLRNFTFNKLKQHYEKTNEQQEKQNKQIENLKSNTKVPNYKVKAPSK